MKRSILKTVITLTAVAMLFGCASSKSGAPEAVNEKKEITVATSIDPKMDHLDAASYEGSVNGAYPMIYDSLVEYGAKGEIKPALAESWEISPDGKTYTFHLRKDVKFSDGTAFNSAAVKFSVERWAHKKEHEWLNVAKNFEALEIVDDSTLKFHFKTNYYLTLAEFTYPRPFRIMSPSSVEPAGDPNGKFVKAIGTAAWVLADYTKDVQTVFTPNLNYWGSKPKVDRLTWKVIPDAQTRVLALQNGTLDAAGGELGKLPLESVGLFGKDKKTEIVKQDSTTSYFLVFNNSKDTFSDVRLRKAINYAVNKDAITNQLFDGLGSPAKGLFQETNPYVTKENNKGYSYDPEQAKKLLNEAGWSDTDKDGVVDKAGKPLTISLVLQSAEFPEWKPICEAIQHQLGEIGIKVELKEKETAAYYDSLWKNKDYDLLIYRTYSDAYNPLGFLSSLFYATDKQPAVAFGSKKLTELIDKASVSLTEAERTTIYNEMFQLMYDEAYCVPVFYPKDIFVKAERLADFQLGTSVDKPVLWEKLDLSVK